MTVRFTDITASKKKALKKLVTYPMILRRMVGRYTVKMLLRRGLPRTIWTWTPCLSLTTLEHML